MRVLLVSPRFPPSSAADSQRIRLLLPHFSAAGCIAEVLAVEPSCSTNALDPWQAQHLPASVPIHRICGLPSAWSRFPGLGSLDARCHRVLARAGNRLIQERGYDLIYFSTTEFGTFRLGPLWKRLHGVPFVLDYQDPWVNDHYRLHPDLRPPGGRLKYAISDRLHRFYEPRVLRHAAAITAVSSAYPATLKSRYSWASKIPFQIFPFPGSDSDFSHLSNVSTSLLPFDPHDGLIHWVSIGRGGADLHTALAGLFSALVIHASAELRNRLRLHFLGTSYAPAGKGLPTIAPLAEHYGLGSIVVEHTDRLPLSIALATLKAADALLVIGSNDPSYTASKLYPYLLANRPLLAIMHRSSSVCNVLQTCGGGSLVCFDGDSNTSEIADRINQAWLLHSLHAKIVPLDRRAFHPHTAEAQAQELVKFFRRCICQSA